MKTIKTFLVLAILCSLGPINAIVPIESKVNQKMTKGKMVKISEQENIKYLKKEDSLIGTWSVGNSTASGVEFQVRITSILPSRSKGMSMIKYDTVVGGVTYDDDLTGYLVGNNLFFNISFIQGYSFVTAKFNKSFTSAIYTQNFIQDRVCAYSYTDATYGDIYECVFYTSQSVGVDSGTIVK